MSDEGSMASSTTRVLAFDTNSASRPDGGSHLVRYAEKKVLVHRDGRVCATSHMVFDADRVSDAPRHRQRRLRGVGFVRMITLQCQ